MTKTICIYHANCADGFTAAWAVWKALGSDVEYIPAAYGEAPPDVTGADVIMVDFSYKRPVLSGMADQANSLLILDHHKTAQGELSGFDSPPEGWRWRDIQENGAWKPCPVFTLFDMSRSGAQIAWDYFHPTAPRPMIVDYVADRDLWKWEMRWSREISEWLYSQDMDFGQWQTCANILDTPQLRANAARTGAETRRRFDKDVRAVLDASRRDMLIGGHHIPVANAPHFMASEMADQMAQDATFAATYFDSPTGRKFSLRSRGETGADVAEIAATYGGGGHRNAAGFTMPIGWEGDA
ncbi:DHHA1 domain-containing protein [Shimia thalassica]|uniref:DHHA1 domain-containing protein n=1 Tax=Shimia thalassica TaxID=1715693 RepID=UPI0026E3B1D9|nr:DHHA1 domain-containing protein [Shimia thalassica]MDO6799398.1 DHHA1 domain-containing protein [Shimia thalassica]